MKIHQSLSFFLAVSASAFQLASELVVDAKKHSTTSSKYQGTNNELSAAPQAITNAASTSTSTSSSSSSLRGLRSSSSSSSNEYFFEKCYDRCSSNGGIPTMTDGSTAIIRPTSVDHFKENKAMFCCKGGVSYLKVKFQDEQEINQEEEEGEEEKPVDSYTGTITINAGLAKLFATNDDYARCISDTETTKGTKGTKAGGIYTRTTTTQNTADPALRIIPCDDDCILDPFASVPCSNTTTTLNGVGSGTEICFGMVDPATNVLMYGTKMPIDLHLWFDYGNGEFLWTAIHTSCSVPLQSPFAAALKDPCDHADYDKNELFNLEEISSNSDIEYVPPHLTFLDGISVAYFEAVAAVLDQEDTESYATDFSIGFNDCGCTCESFPPVAPLSNVPTFSPTTASPTASPTTSPTASPTASPTTSPTASPTDSPITASQSPTLTESPSASSTSVSSSSSSFPGKGTPGAPDFEDPPTCAPRCCQELALQQCFFKGTTLPCDVNGDVNADLSGEGGASAPLPDSANENDNGVITIGKGGKGIGKAGSKLVKSIGKARLKGVKSTGKARLKGVKSTGKAGIGKAKSKGGKSDQTGTENDRRRRKLELKKKIERHLSSIDDLNKVLMSLDNP